MRSLIDITDFSVEELYDLLSVASDIGEHPEKYADACRGKKLATLFFEPSTRTRLSFEAAMLELGGNVIGVHHEHTNAGSDINGCYLHVVLETRNFEHVQLIRNALSDYGFKLLD